MFAATSKNIGKCLLVSENYINFVVVESAV